MNDNYNTNDTIVALATVNGVGGLHVIRISGSKSIKIAQKIFHGKSLENVKSHTIHFGTIKDENLSLVDEVLLSIFRNPRSYTKEDTIEISCHGSPYIVQRIIELTIKNGARLASPGEFTMRAYMNGQLDLSQAEAVADVIAASNKSSLDLAMQQLRGGYSDEIKRLRQELIDFAALIELELDFSEEDVQFADRKKLKTLIKKIQAVIENLTSSFEYGNAIKKGIPTVIAGRPNAGKSTLLNTLLNDDRAIVSDIAGTTRDTIEEILVIEGISFRIIDTAGIREAKDQIEAIGVEKTMHKIAECSILIYVFDMTTLSIEEVRKDLETLERNGLNIIAIANKYDLNKTEVSYPSDLKIIKISAKEKKGIDALKKEIIGIFSNERSENENIIVTNARHYQAFLKSLEALENVILGMDNDVPSDILAMDIRQSLNHISTITGEIVTDDLLESIFTRFCIGK